MYKMDKQLQHQTDKIKITLPRPTRACVKAEGDTSDDRKKKEAKFVPYEPYKAAVKPMVPLRPCSRVVVEPFEASRRAEPLATKSVDANKVALVAPLILPKPNVRMENEERSADAGEDLRLKKELEDAKKEITSLKEQMAQQTKVNSELKKLLVASVGEDLETKLRFLTHDKVSLAHDVHHYTQRLVADHEELEKLSIQCDVWRSKFLASSLIVDELAKWKAVLYRRYDDAINTMQMLLDERDGFVDHLKLCLINLQDVEDFLNRSTSNRRAVGKTVTEMAEMTNEISSRLRAKLLRFGDSARSDVVEDHVPTIGEKLAKQILTSSNCDPPLDCLKPLFPVLSSLHSGMVPRFHPNARFEHLTMNCCGQCQGEIQLL